MADLVDEILGFNPTDLDIFKKKEGGSGDANVYHTNPVKYAKSDDGVYRSTIKILLNPFSPKDSIVPQAQYWLSTMDGNRPVRSSLSIGDKNCQLFKTWKQLWFSGDDVKKEFSKKVFQKNESQWVLVQVLEDANQPEEVGKFKIWKLPKVVFDKLTAKMNPAASSKSKPYPVMDYLVGLALNLEVAPGPDDPKAPERKTREISYTLCDFGDYAPIIKTDGTPLLSEEEIDLVDQYVTAYNDSQNGKTAKKKEEATKNLADLKPKLIPIYKKTIQYVKDNLKDANDPTQVLDIVKHCGYQPWDDNTKEFVNHFCEMVLAGVDPATTTYESFKSGSRPAAESVSEAPAVDPQPNPATEKKSDDDELPF